MEKRKKERIVPQEVILQSNEQMKARLIKQSEWRIKNGDYFERAANDRSFCELDRGGIDNVLRECCISGLYRYEGEGIFREII